MAFATEIRRQPGALASAPAWLVVAAGLLGSGCGHGSSAPLASAGAEHRPHEASLVLFPTGPEFKLSAEAAAILPAPWPTPGGRVKGGQAGPSLASASSWPRFHARRSPAAEPRSPAPLRTAERLDAGAATVR